MFHATKFPSASICVHRRLSSVWNRERKSSVICRRGQVSSEGAKLFVPPQVLAQHWLFGRRRFDRWWARTASAALEWRSAEGGARNAKPELLVSRSPCLPLSLSPALLVSRSPCLPLSLSPALLVFVLHVCRFAEEFCLTRLTRHGG